MLAQDSNSFARIGAVQSSGDVYVVTDYQPALISQEQVHMAHPEFIQLMSAPKSTSPPSPIRSYPVWMISLAARVNLGFSSYRHMRRIQESKSRNDGDVSR